MRWFLSLLLSISCIEYQINEPIQQFTGLGSSTELNYQEYTWQFQQHVGAPIDIVVVLDGSCSMLADNGNVQKNLILFLEDLTYYNIDYHMGIMSANNIPIETAGIFVDPYGVNFISPDQNLIFDRLYMAMRMISGSFEAGIDSLYQGLTENLHKNKNVFRHNVPWIILFISDEKDHSIHYTGWQLKNRLNYLSDKHLKTLHTISVINPFDSFGYKQLTNSLNGTTIDILNTNWNLSSQFVHLYGAAPISIYYFPSLCNPDTLDVQIHRGAVVYTLFAPDDFTYNQVENSITLHYQINPAETDIVQISCEGRDYD